MSLAAGAAAKKRRVAAQGSCDAKSKNCKPDVEGLADGLSKLALGAAGDSDAEKDRKLGEALRAVEAKYLAAELTPTQKAKPELVHHITQKFILPNLDNICSGVFYMGSNYEFTTVPGSSDFDIQFCIDIPKTKLNHVKTSSAKAHGCADPAWRMIKGGPEKLQDDKGYLSATKARKAIQSAIDRALQTPSIPPYQGAGIEIRRSTGGPATTLNAEWKGEKVSIDIVVCLRAEDVEESGGHDFVGKPYKGSASNPTGELWRLSYSRKELELLRRFHSNAPRKLLLMRIMKVIKKAQPQLRQFPSYFYKNILFKLEAGKPQPANWDRTGFAQRFKDMVILICESLESQTLMLHFNKQVNLLSSYDKAVVLQTANFLRRLINKNNFIDLPSLVLSKL